MPLRSDVIPLKELHAAAERLAGVAVRTPLVRFQHEGPGPEIYLKLECLQPTGSFKLRGAFNGISQIATESLQRGLLTASSGNFAQGACWTARYLGVACEVLVPDSIPDAKAEAIERLGGRIARIPYDDWWATLETGAFPGKQTPFVHPTLAEGIMAGHGTIGLEIFEDLPHVDVAVVPWGAGGLCIGVASALRHLSPETRIVAVEPETAAPLTASRRAGSPTRIVVGQSWIDAAGGNSLLPGMWEKTEELVDETQTVSLVEAADSLRLLAQRAKVVAEGAGALALAAALSGRVEGESMVCVVSGGNCPDRVLLDVLAGNDPLGVAATSLS